MPIPTDRYINHSDSSPPSVAALLILRIAMEKKRPYKVHFSLPLSSSATVDILQRVLRVDEEPKPDTIGKKISMTSQEHGGGRLVVEFDSHDLKMLRVALNSFFDMLLLSLETIAQFSLHAADNT